MTMIQHIEDEDHDNVRAGHHSTSGETQVAPQLSDLYCSRCSSLPLFVALCRAWAMVRVCIHEIFWTIEVVSLTIFTVYLTMQASVTSTTATSSKSKGLDLYSHWWPLLFSLGVLSRASLPHTRVKNGQLCLYACMSVCLLFLFGHVHV